MDADEPEDCDVAIRQVQGSDGRRSLETGKAGGGHSSSVSEAKFAREGRVFARDGKPENFLACYA